MNELKRLSSLSSILALASLVGLVGCSAEVGEEFESVEETSQALESCDFGYAYNGGTWQRKVVIGSCPSLPTYSFGFGIASDIPLLFGTKIATYGTEAGDRRGRFFIDQDDNLAWGGSDTYTKFMSSPQAGDQPFTMMARKRSGSSCAQSGDPIPVVGIKRGSTWYIDTSANGVWDGTGASQCDLQVSYGIDSDLPTPLGQKIGVTRPISGNLRWFVDENGDFAYNTADGDGYWGYYFGDATDLPFYSPQGTQRDRNIHVNRGGTRNWEYPPDEFYVNYLDSSSWRFVGLLSYFKH